MKQPRKELLPKFGQRVRLTYHPHHSGDGVVRFAQAMENGFLGLSERRDELKFIAWEAISELEILSG